MVEGKKHYVGTYEIPDGQRTVHYRNGDTFVGTVKGGSKSQGKYTYKNGDYFNGTFSNGSWDTGYGKKTEYDGSYYVGNFKNGLYNGQGTYNGKSSDGDDYIGEGNFLNGSLHGWCKQRWPKEKRKSYSCMYEGNFVIGQRQGKGTWYYNNHTYTTVMMKNGKKVKTIEEGTWR